MRHAARGYGASRAPMLHAPGIQRTSLACRLACRIRGQNLLWRCAKLGAVLQIHRDLVWRSTTSVTMERALCMTRHAQRHRIQSVELLRTCTRTCGPHVMPTVVQRAIVSRLTHQTLATLPDRAGTYQHVVRRVLPRIVHVLCAMPFFATRHGVDGAVRHVSAQWAIPFMATTSSASCLLKKWGGNSIQGGFVVKGVFVQLTKPLQHCVQMLNDMCLAGLTDILLCICVT